MNIEATFVRSAAGASDLPRDGLAEVALVGRSNVGKSSLINALVRQRVARTSGAPGKTRLANVYRVTRGGGAPLYLLDLPGYGYARASRQERGALSPAEARRASQTEFESIVRVVFEHAPAGLLLVDARHPGLEADRQAWGWLQTAAAAYAIVATKVDKLSRAERLRAIRALEAVFEHSVLPVSAVTGEGLDELWTLIERLLSNSPLPPRRSPPPRNRRPPEATAPPAATARRPSRHRRN